MIRPFLVLAACLLGWLAPAAAHAHEIRPVFLDIRETDPGTYAIALRRPVFDGRPLSVAPRFPEGCTMGALSLAEDSDLAVTERAVVTCRRPLTGAEIGFEGLSGQMVDALARLELRSGQTASAVVRPSGPVWRIPAATGAWDVFRAYLRLGVEHILLGADHLLFVFGLVLLVKSPRRVLLTATAFTLAHSLTLSAAALGVLHVPPRVVEALIALSIVFLALEVLRAERRPDLARGLRPGVMAFGFGLLHGLGFASALADIGLPRHEIPAALLAFNVGVELGQVAFILVLLAAGSAARLMPTTVHRPAFGAGVYAVGSLAAFWTLQRLAAF